MSTYVIRGSGWVALALILWQYGADSGWLLEQFKSYGDIRDTSDLVVTRGLFFVSFVSPIRCAAPRPG